MNIGSKADVGDMPGTGRKNSIDIATCFVEDDHIRGFNPVHERDDTDADAEARREARVRLVEKVI